MFKNKQDLVSKWILEVRDMRKGSLGCLPHFWVLEVGSWRCTPGRAAGLRGGEQLFHNHVKCEVLFCQSGGDTQSTPGSVEAAPEDGLGVRSRHIQHKGDSRSLGCGCMRPERGKEKREAERVTI